MLAWSVVSFCLVRRALACVVALASAVGTAAFAQEQRSALGGVVRDAQHAVLPGATVSAVSTNGSWSVTTGDDGTYRFGSLAPGVYLVTVTLAGFEPARVSVPLSLGETKHVDAVLAVAAVAEQVHVVAESPVVDVTSHAAYQTIRNELVDKLPRGRDFTSLVTFAPGANVEPLLGGISIDGASGSENQFVIDGLTTTELRTGASGKTLVPDFVEEVQVKSSGYAAEFGGSTGGVINVLTRSGTNSWSGAVVAYYGGDTLEAAPRKTLQLNPSVDTRAEYVAFPADDYSRWEPGFILGGPIRRDRLWLFAGYIPSLTDRTRRVVFQGGSAEKAFEQQTRTHNATASLQAQVSQRLRGRAAMNLSGSRTNGTLPSRNGTSSPLGPFDTTTRSPNSSVSANADYSAAASLMLAARGGYFSTDLHEDGIPDEIVYTNFRSSVDLPGVPANLQHGNGYSTAPTNSLADHDRLTRLALGGDATYYAQAAGRHTVRAGLQYERYTNDVLRGDQQPTVRLFWNATRNLPDGRRVRGAFGHYAVAQSRTFGEVESHTLGLFVQDSWAIGRVTINAGVRSEHERVPSFTALDGYPSTAIDFGFGEKLAPRLGAAWDVTGDGRWKAYGSWGIFYDIMKLGLPRASFGGEQSVREFFTLDAADWPSLTGPSPFDDPAHAWPGTFIQRIELVHPSNDPADNRIDPDLAPFEQREFTLGMEHALNARTAITVRYVRKDVVRAVEDVGTVDERGGERFFVANPGYGIARTLLPTQCGGPCPDQPPSRRQYDGLEFRLRRRLADHWSLNASYLFSRLYGNYSGLANSDEVGRGVPNVTRNADALYISYDAHGRITDGRLATDRPHQVKLQAIADFAFGTTVGVSWSGRSGTPITTEMSELNVPFYPFGRGDLGRTPFVSEASLYVQHEFRLGSRYRVQVHATVINLFDQAAATAVFYTPYRETLNLSDREFFAGFDAAAVGATLQRDARFGQASSFQDPRAVTLGAKLLF